MLELALLARALKVLLHEMPGGTLAVYLDFCSLHSGTRSETEEALYTRAVARQGDLYCHPHMWTLLVTQQTTMAPLHRRGNTSGLRRMSTAAIAHRGSWRGAKRHTQQR